MAITVEPKSETSFNVTVTGAIATSHNVTVTPEYCRKLTGGRVSAEVLVAKSFEFLLERESNSSILRSFDLAVIQQYFPEYERIVSEMLG